MPPVSLSPVSRPFVSLWFVLVFAAAALVLWAALPPPQVMALMSEDGPVEIASATLYFVTAVALWFVRGRSMPAALAVALSVVLCAFGARELDLHKAWTGVSTLKVSFYLGAAPLQQKLAALAVIGPAAYAMVYLLLRYGLPVLRGLRQRDPVAVTVIVFWATLVLSKLIDRSQNVLLEDFGIQFSPALSALRSAWEEGLELCAGVLIWVGLLQHRRQAGAGSIRP
ncbi:hypothetical protein M8A51_19080 [Schlegelella sp. S2-27]|uniref:Uncharacterized protein n=1 Tax=Caldimonas mangrovi TaxID=2944811 RepID=A0ABT0YSB9_9BURK|nr:hypothetical protein [Caldimonas mangrovi]MCM5681635.1 hypothetical protein [Caldimonas mangrovi]